MLMKKITERQNAIKKIVQNNDVGDQETLVSLLKHHYNIDANQSQVSRDLRSLGIHKKSIGDHYQYELDNKNISKEILQLCIINADHNETTIVIYTLPGLAAFVADYLDMQDNLDLLGTISGENTVLIMPKSIQTIKTTFKQICTVIYLKKNNNTKDNNE